MHDEANWEKNEQSIDRPSKFAIKIDLSVSISTLMIEFWTTIVLSVIRFSIAQRRIPCQR